MFTSPLFKGEMEMREGVGEEEINRCPLPVSLRYHDQRHVRGFCSIEIFIMKM